MNRNYFKDWSQSTSWDHGFFSFQEVVLYCIATGNVEVNARDNAGYTPLHECCVRGHRPIAIQLLKYGADVNCVSVDGIR